MILGAESPRWGSAICLVSSPLAETQHGKERERKTASCDLDPENPPKGPGVKAWCSEWCFWEMMEALREKA
jgi:hypothetical protein